MKYLASEPFDDQMIVSGCKSITPSHEGVIDLQPETIIIGTFMLTGCPKSVIVICLGLNSQFH